MNSYRKRKTSGSPLIARTKTSRGANARRTANRLTANVSTLAVPSTETIAMMDNADGTVEEVVDLTCEGTEASVVDLTNNDSVLLVDEGPQNERVPTGESYVVSSDEDEDAPPIANAAIMPSVQSNSSSRSTPGTISCPVCLDSYLEPVVVFHHRLWRADDWLFPLNVVTSSAVSV
uniref:RING finger protein 4 isoform X2 n=1 Tax=Gasterosteus aculeatus aculeatus TaxID=481459 RepID=UPI001A9879A1|nr:RING finger protein 4 isoform X2 [Gasterosteus aculeatus aculeatus]